MVYYYNPHTSLLKTFLVFKGTVWQCVLSKFEFWLYMGIQLVVSLVVVNWRGVYGDNEKCYKIEDETACVDSALSCSWVSSNERTSCTPQQIDAMWSIDWAPVKLGPPFMVFLIVFFLGNCYSRYLKLYKACMGIDEALKLFVQEMAICCNKPEVRKHLHLATKYMAASVFAFYFGLTHGKVADSEWEFLYRKGLVDREEIEFLKTFPGHRGLLLSAWSLRVVAEMIRTKEISGLYSPPERGALFHRITTHATRVCQTMRFVADLLAMPIPFAYWHILNIVLGLNFFIVGYTLSVKTESVLSCVPFAVFLFVFMGLRSLSATLADPFRESSRDPMGCAFPLVSFVNYTYDHAVVLLASIDHFDPQRRATQDDAFFRAEQVASSVSHQLMYYNLGEDGNIAGRQRNHNKNEPHSTPGVKKNFTHVETETEAVKDRGRQSINTYLRGEQVNVAYKWDPAGLIKKGDAEEYLLTWLRDKGLDQSTTVPGVDELKAAPGAEAGLSGGPVPPQSQKIVAELEQMAAQNEKALEEMRAAVAEPLPTEGHPSDPTASTGSHVKTRPKAKPKVREQLVTFK